MRDFLVLTITFSALFSPGALAKAGDYDEISVFIDVPDLLLVLPQFQIADGAIEIGGKNISRVMADDVNLGPWRWEKLYTYKAPADSQTIKIQIFGFRERKVFRWPWEGLDPKTWGWADIYEPIDVSSSAGDGIIKVYCRSHTPFGSYCYLTDDGCRLEQADCKPAPNTKKARQLQF